MLREDRTEVLVVGAGPVGMLTALLLAQGGVRVRIVDQESRTASRTYACALHPRTLKLLDRLGLAREVLSVGRKVGVVAFYEGETRRAEAALSQLQTDFPFVVVLPQSAFEGLLEQRLKREGAVSVEWNHQLSSLRPEPDGVVAVIDKLGVSAKGYIVPEMEWSVEKTEETRAAYVVGADGPNSTVAQSLGGGYQSAGDSQFFAVYEIESDWASADELRIVLDPGTVSVLWPLPGNKFRWSFQLLQEHLRDFPKKERNSLLIGGADLDRENRQFIQKLTRERAPWFRGNIQELGWSTDVEFQQKVAHRFGQQRCWLAGDAAHQTGPAGMQSMNAGLSEAEQLAASLIRILREKASPELLETYHLHRRNEWLSLLGLTGGPKPGPGTDPWVAAHRTRILPGVPATDDDLKQLLNQLKLDLG